MIFSSSSGNEEQDDFGIDANANRPGARRDETGKTFRDSPFSDYRFYNSLVGLSALLVVLCVLGAVKRGSAVPLALAVPFLISLGALLRMRSAATAKQLSTYGWIAGGGVVVGFLAIAVATMV